MMRFIAAFDRKRAEKDAAKAGYRNFDTTQAYVNGRGVGNGARI